MSADRTPTNSGVYYSGLMSPIVGILAGWCISRLLFSTVRGMELGPFILLPAAILLMVALLKQSHSLAQSKLSVASVFIGAGMLADACYYWLVRPGSFAASELTSPWEARAWWGSLVGLAAILVFVFALLGITKARPFRRANLHEVRWWEAALAFVACLGTVLAYRITNILLRDVPNEDRSLMIGGIEVHHFHHGIVLWVLLHLAIATRTLKLTPIVFLLDGVFAGAVLDQLSYILIRNCTDDAYFGNISNWGAVLGVGLYALAVLGPRLKKNGSSGSLSTSAN